MSEIDNNEKTINLDDANLDDIFALAIKKKKKKKNDEDKNSTYKKKKKIICEDEDIECNYTYLDLLKRIKSLNPDLESTTKLKLPIPTTSLIGSTRTCWDNFAYICSLLKRNPEHVLQFFLTELGTEGSIDAFQCLVLKGRFVPRKIESLLRKYILEYVTCNSCRNPDTRLARNPASRLYFINCSSCGSSRTVTIIKAGYQAVRKGERKKARNI